MGGYWHHLFWSRCMEKAGFEIVSSEDASINKHQYPLIQKAMSEYGYIGKVVDWLAYFGLLPKYFPVIMERFNLYASSFVQMDKLGMITSSWKFVLRKPEA
eukprot:609135-Pleurochrysis_carterae.AAC.2